MIPYIQKQMAVASSDGIPVMRPMFLEFPEDKICYTTGDQYMFGPDILFAPITVQGQTARKVYLPSGKWILTKDHETFDGNQWITVEAKINEFIAFVRDGADVINLF